jgi:hypothetical protein
MHSRTGVWISLNISLIFDQFDRLNLGFAKKLANRTLGCVKSSEVESKFIQHTEVHWA